MKSSNSVVSVGGVVSLFDRTSWLLIVMFQEQSGSDTVIIIVPYTVHFLTIENTPQ